MRIVIASYYKVTGVGGFTIYHVHEPFYYGGGCACWVEKQLLAQSESYAVVVLE